MRKPILIALLVVAAFLAFRYFTGGGERVPADAAAQAILDGATVVDARTDREYAGGHLAGALHADVLDTSFRQLVDSLDRSGPVYVYCASGHRSGRAASILEEMGFQRVVNAGGIGELAAAGVPME